MLRKRKSSFIYIILSLALVSILPILVLIFYMYPRFNELLETEAISYEISIMNDLTKSFESEMLEVSKLPAIIGQEFLLNNYVLNKEPYSRYRGVAELRKYVATNMTIKRVFIWYQDRDYLVSDAGIHEIATFEEEYLPLERLQVGGIDLTTVDEVNSLLITMASPMANCRVIVEISESAIKEISSGIDGTATFMILNGDNDVLFSSLPIQEKELKVDIIEDVLASPDAFQYEKYQIMGKESEVINGLKYLNIVDTVPINEKVSEETQVTLMLITGLLLIESILIYFLAKYNYRPVRQLIASLLGEDYSKMRENEFQLVQQHVSELKKDYRYIYKHNIIRDVINGKINTIERFNQLGKAHALNLSGERFYVIMLRFITKEALEDDIINRLETMAFPLTEGIKGEFTYGFNENTLLFLAGVAQETTLLNYLTAINELLQSSSKYHIYIGVSQGYEKLTFMNDAYVEAMTTVEYQIFNHQSGIMRFSDVPKMDSKKNYPVEKIYYFRTALLRGDQEKASQIFTNLINQVSNGQNNITYAKMVLFNLYRIISEFSSINGKAVNYFYSSSDIREMIKTVKEGYAGIDIVGEIKENIQGSGITDILLYVNKNYKDENLSLQVLADIFNMSQSNLSHSFKSHTNFGFKDYVNQLRVDKSKRYLLETAMEIKDIATYVGFSSPATYTRNFKNYVGLTPSGYRNSNNQIKKTLKDND